MGAPASSFTAVLAALFANALVAVLKVVAFAVSGSGAMLAEAIHGLPVELGVEKELGITKEDIGTKISVEEYNRKCREAIMRYKDKWEEITEKMGYWVDMKDPYITFDNKYIETIYDKLANKCTKGRSYKQ